MLTPALSPTAGVAVRARELKQFLDRHAPGESVHIIAHSMGGLDARYMISCLGMSRRVLSLTTLGTPHRGSPVADWGVQRLKHLLRPIFQFFDVPTQAFYDLTTTKCKSFNERVIDAPSVRYFSVAGEHDGSDWRPEWLAPYFLVHQAEGPNDGLVSITSASYGESVDIWQGDHLSLVNFAWAQHGKSGRDPVRRWRPLLGRLADEGF